MDSQIESHLEKFTESNYLRGLIKARYEFTLS